MKLTVANRSELGADFGIGPTSGFNFSAVTATAAGGYDLAPDVRTFNYQLVAGTPPPVLGPDTRPPLDEALRSRGTHGKIAHLNYVAAAGRRRTPFASTEAVEC
jgi:hypothetical protein